MKKVLLFIVLFLCIIGNVKAENVTLTKDVYDNTYVYYYDSNLGRTRYLKASKYLFGTTAAYCIELGKDISSFEYNVTNSFDGININKDDLDYIKLVSYYGYNYPGHDTDRFYLATQGLIWKRLVRTSIKFTIGFDPDVFYNLTNEETIINVLVNRHKIKPSFDGTTIDVVKGEEIILEDSNNVLYLYYSDDDNVVIDNNKLIIKKGFDKKSIVLKRHNYTNKDFFLYSSGNSQKMMSSGGITNSTSELNVNLISGSIEIKKYDKETLSVSPQGDATLDGAIYELYDGNNNFIDNFVTGKKSKIENLGIGKYYIKEKKASTGYLIDNNVYEVEITKDNFDNSVIVYEDVIKRKVELFKVYASDDTGFLVGESDIRFDIFDKNGNFVNYIVTDNDGYASIYLPYGIYNFKQINSTKDYYKIDDFEIVIDSNDERPIYKLISNSEIKAKVRVIKKDVDTLENIINGKASFKIFDVKNNKYVSFKISYPEDKIIDVFDIDDNGIFTTPFELGSGDYILYEVDSDMNGYLYNKEGVPFSIGESSNTIMENNDVILEVPFYNKIVKGTLNILKYGESIKYSDNSYFYSNILLDNVKFNLYAEEDIYENSKLIYNKDSVVDSCTTINGICSITDLPLGNYYLKEISSSGGNVINSTVYKIEFNYKDQYTKNIIYDLEAYNYLPKGKLVITKYETGSSKRISDTLIEIRNINNEIIYKGYTDKNGQIVLDDMLYGEYYISEVEASTGYKLTYDKIFFEIGEDDTCIDIYNERIKVPNTGIGFGLVEIVIIIFSLLDIFIGILFFRNKKILVVCLFILLLSFLYFGIKFYNYYNDKQYNEKAVEAVLNNRIDSISSDKYRYKAILEIPSIGLKRGILDINNKYNFAKYNIELVKEDNDMIVLASHNGNNYNSYFGKLKNISLGDEINYYYNGKIYKYIYTDSYEIRKDGYADIYRKKSEKSIILVTCKDNSDDAQIVFIGYLNDILEY